MGSLFEEVTSLMHYGVSKKDGAAVGSGRYPLGSGENPHQHGSGDFISRVQKMRDEGFTYTDKSGRIWTGDTAIAKALGMTTTQFRVQYSLAKDERRALEVAQAKKLRAEGKTLDEIATIMGYENDSSIRSLLNVNSEARMNQARKTAEFLRSQVDEKGMIDVGAGVEQQLGVSKEKLSEALYILESEGYHIYGGGVPQVTNKGKQTNLKVLAPPDAAHKDIYDFDNIHYINDYVSHDGGDSFDPRFVYPKSMNSSRLAVRYGDEGGSDKDGVIELRRGVEDLSLGESHYAQVRIMVDDDHYLKGMAVYSDDLPDGVDVLFNTNKPSGTPLEKVLKPIKKDKDGNPDRENPFGSLIKDGVVDPDDPSSREGGQSYYYDKDGKKQLSLINKRADEGDWGEWSNKLPSQFLSKQSMQLINRQLGLAKKDKDEEFAEICALTNPTVKKKLLESFANDCDSAAVHLQAAALPRQRYQVILPLTEAKDNEIYAPNYRDGETVALIRYPHGGTFEIPIVKVNNKLQEGKRVIGDDSKDAVGINSNVASRLSGADFDGDTVMVIPCNSLTSSVKISSTLPLKGLEGFDPKLEYGGKEEGTYKRMGKTQTQNEMGRISNLITDMTLKGATEDELARAVRHSMVVIDAEKHGLDYKQSERDNQIAALKQKYQGHVDEQGNYHEGAATLISRAKSEVSVPKRQGSPKTAEDGSLVYKTADNLYYIDPKTGRTKMRTQESTRMAETKDAHTLSSGTPQEEAYADYANHMKDLANRARLEKENTPRLAYSPSARVTYAKEYDSLTSKLRVSEMNAPRERQAQVIANQTIAIKKSAYPDMTSTEEKKVSQQALTAARNQVGAKRTAIAITPREWEAIQAGAITDSVLSRILKYADEDTVRQYATPKYSNSLSDAKIARINAMKASGYTSREIADAIGISVSTVAKYS